MRPSATLRSQLFSVQGLLVMASLLVVVIHLITLSIFPLPWFDEVFFASIAQNYLENGSLVPEVVAATRGGHESLSYGPVYFVLSGLSIKLFGLGPGAFRLVACLSGIGAAILLRSILLSVTKNATCSGFLAFLLLMDPFFVLGMHQGRMEPLVVFLVLGAFYLHQRQMHSGYSSILMALAFLTTPRSFVLLVPLVIWMTIDLLQRHQSRQLWSLYLPAGLLVFAWIIGQFGSPMAYIEHMTRLAGGNASAVHGYVGFNMYLPPQEWLLIAIALAVVLWQAIRYRGNAIARHHWFILGSLALFYLLIYDWGPYSVLVLPLFYFLIGERPVKWLLLPLLVFNIAYTGVKFTQSLLEWNRRKGHVVEVLMDKLPPNSLIAGKARYYYHAVNAGHQFQLYDQYGSAGENAHKLGKWADYLIIAVPENSYSKKFRQHLEGRLTFISEYTYTDPVVQQLYDWAPIAQNEAAGLSYRLYHIHPLEEHEDH